MNSLVERFIRSGEARIRIGFVREFVEWWLMLGRMWSSMSLRTAPALAAAVTTAMGAGGSAAGLLLASLTASSNVQASTPADSNEVGRTEEEEQSQEK